MANEQTIENPDIQQQEAPPPSPDNGGGQPQPSPNQSLYNQLRKSQLYTKSYDDFQKQFSSPQAIDKLYQGLNESQLYTKAKDSFYSQFFPSVRSGSTSNVDQGIRQTTKNLNQSLQFNGTFKPDLEGEKNGLYLNDPDYQKQKNDFVNRIATDPNGTLLYPEQDQKTGKWSNYYTKQPLPGFDPHQMEGKILQVPHEYLPATGGKQFITPAYDPKTNSYSFPGVQTPDVPTQQTLPEATVYGKKGKIIDNTAYSEPTKTMIDESDKQKGDLRDILTEHPELDQQIQQTLKKYGPEYTQSLQTGSGAMANVLQKTIEDNYNLNRPLPQNVNGDVLNSHLNVLNNFEKNRQAFEATQQDLQRQADLLTDRSKRTGQPLSQEDAQRLAQKASDNIQKWNNYIKSVQFAQNYVNQPEVKAYLAEFKNRQTGLKLLDEIRQRAFPDEVNNQIKQDEYDRRALEGNLNAWDYTKTAVGTAGKGFANIGETAAKILPGALVPGLSLSEKGNSYVEHLNNNVQQYLSANLPSISPEAIDEMNKKGMGHLVNDLSSTVGGFAPYIVPGLAEEGLGVKAATFGTALAEALPEAKQEALKQGLTGSAYNTFVAAKPLVSAAFMTLLPNVKFAKGFDNDVAKAVMNGEFNNPKQALLNLAKKVITPHPGDIAHLQAMLSGTALGNALVNKITNGLQATEDLQRGISRKEGLPVEMSEVFNPKKTIVMALAGKLMEAIPTLKNSISDMKVGSDVQITYNNIQNNLLELAGHNLEGVSKKVNELVQKDPGNLYAQHLKQTIEDFAHAEARMPVGLVPEQKSALFDIQQKIAEKQRQMATADPIYQPHLQKNIEELSKQIPDILKDPQKANDYLASGHKQFAREILNTNATEDLLTANRQKDLADLKEREATLDPKSATYGAKKEALEKERAETEDYYNSRLKNISSSKNQTNGKAENAEAEGRQEVEIPKEGAPEQTSAATSAPSIEQAPWARTLDYGSNKGKEETQEAQDKIKNEILNDEPIGGNGERFSDLLARVLPGIQKTMSEEPHNTAVVTHSSVIKVLDVWEEMGRPDISELKGDKLREFAQKYVDLKPEAEGKVHTFKGDNGNEIKVIRHGETEDNVASEFREDNTQLTDKGKAQAQRAGQNLINETGGNVPKIISSDLPRTLHTSDIINQKLKAHAVQVGRTEEVLQRPQEGTASAGSERGRVESGQQGNESPGESGQSGQSPQEESKDEGKKAKVEEEGWPFIEEESDNEFTSTKNAIVKQKIEEHGLKKPMEEAAREFGEVWKQAQDKLNKGYDIEKLIKSLDSKPRAVTDLENAMILFHQNVKEAQLAEANKDIADAIEKKKPEDLSDAMARRAKLLDDLQSIYNVDKKIGRETARGLNARKMMADRRFSLVNMQLEKRAATGGEPLSDTQMAELKAQYEEIKRTKDALDARVAELEKENAILTAEKSVSTEAKITGRTRKTKGEYSKERKDIVKQMREDLLRAAKGGSGLTSSIPFAAQLKAAAPYIGKLVKSFIEEGIDKLEDITKEIYNILKPDIPDLEERHVHDLIAGVYNEPNPKGEPPTYAKVKAQAKVQKYRATDPKTMKLQADYEKAKDRFLQGIKVDERKSMTTFQKAQDAFLKYERFAKLSNPITLGKLAMAAVTRLATTPIEEGVGAAYSSVLPEIAKKAPGEAGANVSALAKGYKAAFMRGLDDAATVAKGGHTDIEAVFGKHGTPSPEALDFFGQLHSAIKAPVKRFAFERSFQKRLANNIKNGVTIDGLTEARIAMEAYKDAQRSIFMQDNPISKGWTTAMSQLEKSGDTGKLVATIGQWLIPFVKVPTNILGETISHVAGPEIALTKIISTSLGKGLKNLSQDEAESVMRNLKKGTIGHVALMAGYLNPQIFGGYYQKDEKRNPNDVKAGDMKIGGVNIPAWALEAPLFQAMQLGATVRRVKDTMVKGQEKGLGEGIWGGALGLMSHEPLIDEPSRLGGMLGSPSERQYFIGELAKSTLIPAMSDYAAKVLDPADKRPIGEKAIEPENKRQPETVGEHIKSAIPGLREDVGEKKPKGHRQTQHHGG